MTPEEIEVFMRKKTALPVPTLLTVFLILMFAIPMAAAVTPIFVAPSTVLKIVAATLSPFVFAFLHLLVAGLLSMPFHKAIVPGKFPRNLSHFVYGPRRLYAICWTAIFYCTPLYHAFLSVPQTRKLMFWLFGYRGHSEVAIAPDAWIRDLPCLKFSKGVYTANKCTIGTNMCLSDGTIFVENITLGENTMIGHMVIIGPGTHTEGQVELGVNSAVGIRPRFGANCRVGPGCSVNHGAEIGESADIGPASYIGVKAKIGSGIKMPSASNIPDGSVVQTQADLDAILRNERNELLGLKQTLRHSFADRVKKGA